MKPLSWECCSTKEVLTHWKTSETTGLSEKEARKRQSAYGINELNHQKPENLFVSFLNQMKDFMIVTLLVAALVSFAVSYLQGHIDFIEPSIILAIVILNAILGIVQEARARRSLAALKELSAPLALCLRDGVTRQIEASALVPGDIILLETGHLVPADARILTSLSLSVEESTLTGETHPVEKEVNPLSTATTSIADKANMVFAGTIVVGGSGTAVVTATGMQTELGRIADLISSETPPDTPLQKKLNHTGKLLGILALGICVLIFFLGIMKKQPLLDMFMTSVSLGVAAIPESLPALVTIMLSLGVERMAKKNAVIRRLPAVETLGSATVICSDKTGTLTENRMTMTKSHSLIDSKKLFEFFVLASHGHSPVEKAIHEYAKGQSFPVKKWKESFPLIDEIPFDSKRKRMTTIHTFSGGLRCITKGAPEIVLARCTKILTKEGEKTLSSLQKKHLGDILQMYAGDALRVLAIGYRDFPKTSVASMHETCDKELIFVGFAAFMDPPRKEAASAVAKCKRAGIRPVMITGDHKLTAASIAQKLGICKNETEVLTGPELEQLTDTELSQTIHTHNVYARVSPTHKVRLVKAFQAQGEVVAMTGDGVNDAPALQKADIGCAMGKSGTDVAKNAADMVLMDDNFATIIDAVEEGRGIYQNIKKAVHFLLSCNIGEIMTILAAILLGHNSPLLPVQLLFINLVTDSFPAICLGLEAPEKDIMKEPPRSDKKGLFGGGGMFRIFVEGMLIGSLALFSYLFGCKTGGEGVGSTMCFAVLSLSQLVHSFNMRSASESLFHMGILGNRKLAISSFLCIALQCAVVTCAPLQFIFHTVPLSPVHWGMVAALSLMPIPLVELEKRTAS
ncbi:MAG: cation-translocating P-type ATPase [Eubacterium sp.]